MDGIGQRTLRAKYLDWCSARLAERFLDLSPEEIYALARPDEAPPAVDAPDPGERSADAPPGYPADHPGPSASGSRRLPRPTDEGYRALVQRVTEVLLQRTSLPTFDQWSEAYAETPERFEVELLGFWKDAVSAPEGGPEEGGENATP